MPAFSLKQKVLFFVVLVVLIVFPLTAFAAGPEDFTYTESGGEITITGYLGVDANVEIPGEIDGKPVTGIDDWAFENAEITSVTIPDSVRTIGVSAFSFTGIETVDISANVTLIDYWAFEGCYSLTAITVDPANTTYTSQNGILYNEAMSTLICCPAGKTGAVTVPENVTSIDLSAFEGCWEVTEVILPGTLLEIGNYAFESCSITEILLPESVQSIGECAFRYCGLESVMIPASVTSIGGGAFAYCDNLTEINVDAANLNYSSVDGVLYNEIPNALLQYPAGIDATSFTVPTGVTEIGTYAFGGVYLTDVTLPTGLTTIGDYAFDYSDLINIDIPDSVTSIGEEAFNGCSDLKSVALPNGITSIEDGTLKGCYSLEEIIIPAGVDSLGARAFSWCELLTKAIFLGNAPSTVGEEVFADCAADFTIYYQTGATGWTNPWNEYDTQAFDPAAAHTVSYDGNDATGGDVPSDGGTYLFGDSVTVLGNPGGLQKDGCEFGGWNTRANGQGITYAEGSTFTMSVTDVVLYAVWEGSGEPEGPQEWEQDGVTWYFTPLDSASCTLDGCDKFTGALTIPATLHGYTVRAISDDAFVGSGISSVIIPEGVWTIETWAFYGCEGLQSAALPQTLDTIDGYAFYNCVSLSAITIPQFVEYIGPGVFAGCDALTAINVDEDNAYYTSVGGVLFDAQMKTVVGYPAGKTGAYTIPSGITVIGEGAFEGCDLLTGVTIPSSVKTIGYYAFSSCDALTSVSIPSGVTMIRVGAFEACLKLTAINVDAANSAYKSVSGVLFDKSGKILMQYPAGRTGTTYSIPGDVQYIDQLAFSSCKKLTGITIPASVDAIYPFAFLDCTGLTSVTIPNGVLQIYDLAFADCENLTTVSIPASVTEIGLNVFEGCPKLTSINVNSSNTAYSSQDGALFNKARTQLICYPAGNTRTSYTIPDGVKEIAELAFYESGYLQVVKIPASVDSVGDGAFVLCSHLTEAHFRGNVPGSYFGDYVFEETASNFRIFYPQGATGWSTPTWRGYNTVVELGMPSLSSAVSAGYDRATLTWTAVTNAGGYEIYYAASATGAYTKIATATPGSTLSYTVASLTAGKTYYFKVRAYSGSGAAIQYGDYSSVLSVTPVPSAPGGTVAAVASYSSVRVAWNAVSGASGYQLYRATSQNGTYSLIKTTTSLSYTNTSLSTGRTYYYKVRAYRTVGSSKVYGSYSAIVSAKPMLSSVTTATASAYYPTSIKISWNSVSGRTRYEVWRGTTPDTSKFTKIGTTSSTYYKDTTCTPFVTYYYQIKVYRTVSGQKVYSSSASPTASARPILNNVTGVKAAMSSASSIKISWSSVTGASGYEVLRSTSPDSGFAVIKSTSSRSYTDSNRIPNTTYYYRVQAYRKVGSSRVYSTAMAASATPYFGPVTGAKAVMASAGSIKISWKSVSGRTGYEIYRSTAPDGVFTLIKTTTSTSYTNTNLVPNTTYYYKVLAYRTVSGTKYRSQELAAVTAVLATPYFAPVSAPKAARYNSTKIKLTWNSVSGRTGYEIYRSTSPDGGFVSIGTTTSTSYYSGGLTTGVTYYYKVLAYRTVNGVKYYSQTLESATVVSAKP